LKTPPHPSSPLSISKQKQLARDFTFWESDADFYNIGAVAPRSNCIIDSSKLVDAGGNTLADSEDFFPA
jgi:hypothetical protein